MSLRSTKLDFRSSFGSIVDHDDLIREMTYIEKLSTQDRLKLAKKRRKEQLKRWASKEREYNTKKHKTLENEKKRNKKDYKVHFVDSVMLLEAAARNDVEEVRRLLLLSVNPDSTNEDGLTALHQCCIDDSEEMMQLLIEFGATVNAEDSERWTPLHAAATCGHLHLVKYLIEKGANLLAVNADGNMPYDICEDDTTLEYIESEMAKRGVTQELIEVTRQETERRMLADLQELDSNDSSLDMLNGSKNASLLHIAAANGYLSVVEHLLDHHVAVDSRDDDDWQPIHAAACWGHPAVLEMLVHAGANLMARTRNGETPYDLCEDPEIRERLLQLKTEQESRRLQEGQRHRVRRSQSTKHSIRRTSMREKNMTAKKDAREEARMRLQLEGEQRTSPQTVADGHVTLHVDKVTNIDSSQSDVGQEEQIDTTDVAKPSDIHIVPGNPGPSPQTGSTLHGSDSGSKIDIHVHVTVNTSGYTPASGTLADLKKQRSLSRQNVSYVPDLADGSTSVDTNGHHVNVSYEPPSSPTLTKKRFVSGDTSEVIGPPEKSGCCILM